MASSLQESPPLYRTTPRSGTVRGRHWDARIRALLEGGHSFLPLRFSEDGYLFRGLRSGLAEALASGHAGHFLASHSLGDLEKRLGVYFVSNFLGDALAVAGLERDGADAGVVVFPPHLFNEALQEGRAAVLAFAEGGLVFKYPFFCQPPAVRRADCLLVPETRCVQNDSARSRGLCSAGPERVSVEVTALRPPRIPARIVGASYAHSSLQPALARRARG